MSENSEAAIKQLRNIMEDVDQAPPYRIQAAEAILFHERNTDGNE